MGWGGYIEKEGGPFGFIFFTNTLKKNVTKRRNGVETLLNYYFLLYFIPLVVERLGIDSFRKSVKPNE